MSCRCENPNWVLAKAPGNISSPAISQCTECKDIYYGYPRDAERECKNWQSFFALLAKNGISHKGAQNQLFGRYKNDITRGLLTPEKIRERIPEFKEEMRKIGMSSVATTA